MTKLALERVETTDRGVACQGNFKHVVSACRSRLTAALTVRPKGVVFEKHSTSARWTFSDPAPHRFIAKTKPALKRSDSRLCRRCASEAGGERKISNARLWGHVSKVMQRSHFLTIAMASLSILTPALEAAIDSVRLSRARPGLWKPSEFSAVQYSHNT
jgi:hypothetical protein